MILSDRTPVPSFAEGVEVADLVVELTTDSKLCAQRGKKFYLIEKMILMSKDALCAKLGDRLDNVSDGPREKYLHDTLFMIAEIKKRRLIISIESFSLMDKIISVVNEKLKKIEEEGK